jgi:hypothetical protein
MHLIYLANRNITTTIGNVLEMLILYNTDNSSFTLLLAPS